MASESYDKKDAAISLEDSYFMTYRNLKCENEPYVENARQGLAEYLLENCDTYDPLKPIIDQGVLQVMPQLPPMEVVGIDEDGKQNSENINHILETWVRKDVSYNTIRDAVADGFIKSEGFIYEYIAEEYSGDELTYY